MRCSAWPPAELLFCADGEERQQRQRSILATEALQRRAVQLEVVVVCFGRDVVLHPKRNHARIKLLNAFDEVAGGFGG